MTTGPIVIVDYGAGNLRSVARAVAYVDEEPIVTTDPADLDRATAVILPGVGAAQDTMANLEARQMVDPIRRYVEQGRPFLGVCMGLQALFDWSDEGNGQPCLGLIPGTIRHFSFATNDLKIPHMGWNTVEWSREHPISRDVPSGSYFYFVHSFYPVPEDASAMIGRTSYGVEFASVVARGNVVATQFHPEKSGDRGLQLYANFCRWSREDSPESAAAEHSG